MKIVIVILSIFSILLLLSIALCGLWIRYSGKPVEKSGLDFHAALALASVGASLVTIVVSLIYILSITA